ncbi:hypothetical protein MTO96_036491, partial [Rhipicephalus appendiculatus]
ELLTCDFNGWNFCKWSLLGSSEPKWMFGLSRSLNLGPLSYPPDITEGDITCINGSSAAGVLWTSILQSPFVGPQSEPACFSLWYHMFGGRGLWLRLTLEKSRETGGVTKTVLLYQRERTTADRWYNVRRTMSLDSVYNKMVFTITSVPSGREDAVLALGPLELTMGECDALTDGQSYCDFEFDTCGWNAADTWTRERSIASMMGTDAHSGPENSIFILKATQRNTPRDGSLLTSPEWSCQSEPQCLEFWYEYGGKTDPSLAENAFCMFAKCLILKHQVEVKVNEKSELAWQQPSYPGKEWMLARVQIAQDKTFQVIFRAIFADDPTQFVSLDDIVLRPEPCVHPAECDFNDGLCGYMNQFQGNFRWLIGTGRYERRQSQPAVPRTKDTPPFAYLDLTMVGPGTSTMRGTFGLRSPLFVVTNENTQLTIRYYRRGPDITTANLSVTCYGKGSKKMQPHMHSSIEMGEVGQWTTLDVPVKQGSGCQLAVTVTRGPGTNGTMAIASLKVTSLEPAAKPQELTDSPTRCTFEDGTMCGWNPGTLSNQWSLNDPAKKLPEFPRFDHTLKAYRGRFVYVTHDVDYDWGNAVFKSPELDVNATRGACLSFWLFTVHSSHVSLNVWSGTDRLYTTSVRSSHQWEHVVVNFVKPEEKFQASKIFITLRL